MNLLEKKIVIVGTGIGGAGCAALLAKEGLSVTALERNDFPGGKAASFDRESYVYDTGVHCVGGGERGPLGKINSRVGGDLKFNVIEKGLILSIGEDRAHFPLKMGNEDIATDIMKSIKVENEELDNCVRCFVDLASTRTKTELEEMNSLPLKDYVDRFTDDVRFHQIVNALCGMLLVVTYFEASTGEFIYCFSQLSTKASLSYPVGGMGAIASSYLKSFKEFGGEVVFEDEVSRILVDDGKVVGVEAGEKITADIVISNTGILKTVELVGAEHFEKEYVSRANSLRSSFGAVSIKYALDADVVNDPVTLFILDITDKDMIEKYASIFIPVPSLMDSSLAPPGGQMVQAGAVLSPHLKHLERNLDMLDRIEATVEMLYPEISDHIVWKIKNNTDYISTISGRDLGEVIGLAQSYTQCGKQRPDPSMPIEGLYLVGSDAGGRGIGTEMAAESAINVSSIVIEDLGGSG